MKGMKMKKKKITLKERILYVNKNNINILYA